VARHLILLSKDARARILLAPFVARLQTIQLTSQRGTHHQARCNRQPRHSTPSLARNRRGLLRRRRIRHLQPGGAGGPPRRAGGRAATAEQRIAAANIRPSARDRRGADRGLARGGSAQTRIRSARREDFRSNAAGPDGARVRWCLCTAAELLSIAVTTRQPHREPLAIAALTSA